MPSRFQTRKQKILEQLGVPDSDYHDLSPKGSVDEPIRDLIHDINGIEGLVTTSSCSGRISVFLEGQRADANRLPAQESTVAGPGGKGGGGSWLYISHDALLVPQAPGNDAYFLSLFKLKGKASQASVDALGPGVSARYIHLKFESMILHILTSSLEDSQRVLTSALSAGFRESGAVSLNPSKSGELNPMVAVRSTGYSLDAIIGYRDEGTDENVALVGEAYLRTLVAVASERFRVNSERISRFRASLMERYDERGSDLTSQPAGVVEWEDEEERKLRKREEGLARQRALREEREKSRSSTVQESEPGDFFDSTSVMSV